MSSIYIQEPSTCGKVLLKTTFGDIDIELWSREAPKACRNFVQLCLEGFYKDNIFFRVVKGFIAQSGDPTGTGECSESIYGAPYKDEIHSRLRFCRRGLVACANAGKNDNGSQFFFTFNAAPELQGKHTIFGKVCGDTLYNLLKLEESMVDKDDRPIYEQKIKKAVVLNNPFDDIIPRIPHRSEESEKKAPKKEKEKEEKSGVKNFKLLSFGDEAEEDEIETTIENKKFEGKGKSSHDMLNDPKLSSKTLSDEEKTKPSDDSDSDDTEEDEGPATESKLQLEDVRNKLKSGKAKETLKPSQKEVSDDEEFVSSINKERKRKLEDIKAQIKDLRREFHREKKQKTDAHENEKREIKEKSEILSSFEKEKEKYVPLKAKSKLTGGAREALGIDIVKSFQEKVNSVKSKISEVAGSSQSNNDDDESSDSWMLNSLKCDTEEVLAKDANTKGDDWFEISDPRNAINKRRREASKKHLQEKGKSKYH